jgi:hypothetical protein
MAKTKGTTLRGAVIFLKSRREDALRALPPHLHGYLDARIGEGSWYPEEDLLGLIRAMAMLMPGERGRNLEQMGHLSAREHLEGVYAHLKVEDTDPAGIARRAFALWGTMHDSGRGTFRLEEPGEGVFEIRGYAAPSREMCRILTGYFAECLRLAGMRGITVHEVGCCLDGAESCSWRARWQEPAEG